MGEIEPAVPCPHFRATDERSMHDMHTYICTMIHLPTNTIGNK